MSAPRQPSSPEEWLRFFRKRPLCVICARTSEAETIAKELQCEKFRVSGTQIAEVNDNHVFFYGSFDLKDHQPLDYYITSSLRQGIQSFTIHASILFQILRPSCAIHTGVCAAFEHANKIQLTHVIFGEAALNYEEGKYVAVEGKEPVFQPDYDFIRSPTGDMQSFADDPSGWRDRYHYGDYISGSAVREDAETVFKKVRANSNRNVIALDMEASAFLKLCAYTNIRCLGVLKGVSDFGNSRKGERGVYADALRHTAKAVEHWVTHSIPTINWKPNEDDEPGVHISKGYYKNFVKVVLDSWASRLSAENTETHELILPESILGLKIVVPQELNVNFFAEAGQVANIIRDYKIKHVSIGGHVQKRSLFYKAGYLIDFPRTINSLIQNPESSHQIQLFKNAVEKNEYFHGNPPLASLDFWEDFVKWVKSMMEKEQEEAALLTSVRQEQAGKQVSQKVSPKKTAHRGTVPVQLQEGEAARRPVKRESTINLRFWKRTGTNATLPLYTAN